ncbi:MAG: YgaP-like transmembrane domain, partial [Desulfopila sp.]|nr:YgaP-like transmembrane domain [Desulfopila sp.]
TDTGSRAIPLERQVLVGAGSMMLLFTILGFLVSPFFYALNIFMAGGMIFAGVTGACGMARILVMMPWNRQPMCKTGCAVPETS